VLYVHRANKLHVPSQQAGILVLQRLSAGCRLAVKTIPAAHAAAAQLLAQLSMTYFMPFCLTALAMVARIQVSTTAVAPCFHWLIFASDWKPRAPCHTIAHTLSHHIQGKFC